MINEILVPVCLKGVKRVGRGIASGKGKTCGRGVKGQKSRTGVALSFFEGGQQSLLRALPKRGFNAKSNTVSLNINSLLRLIKNIAKQSDEFVIDKNFLLMNGYIKSVNVKVKIYGIPGVDQKFIIKGIFTTEYLKKFSDI